jgi:hypothetical protein
VSHRTPVVTVRDARARGPKMGLLGDGTIDRTTGAIEARGTLVPSYYYLNEAPGRIPLIGGVLERATGGAIEGVDFTVAGPYDDPRVTVHPLSSLAPGALRDLLMRLGL